MVDKKQGRRYTQLHDELTQVYNKKEDNRKAIVEFAAHPKKLFEKVEEGYRENNEIAADNFVDKTVKELISGMYEELIHKFNDFFIRLNEYLQGGSALHRQVTGLMQEMLEQQKRLDSAPLTQKQMGDMPDTLQENIIMLDKKISTSIIKLEAFVNEFGAIKAAYENIINMENDEEQLFGVFYPGSTANLPPELTAFYNSDYEVMHFILKVFRKWHGEAKAAMPGVMNELFPEFAEHIHPAIKKYAEIAHSQVANDLIVYLHTILQDQINGVSLVEKHGKETLEKWRDFYVKGKEHEMEVKREYHKELSDDEWKLYLKKETESMRVFREWEEKRKAAWYDAIQPISFKYLPELLDLEGDHWVAYAVNMRDVYEHWKDMMESIETAIDYQLDPNLLLEPYEVFKKAHHEKFNLMHKETWAKREKRIYGYIPEE